MSGRSCNYSHAEDILLCQVYMEISQDPIIGVQQSAKRLWSRVEESYNNSRSGNSEVRTQRSLQARIQVIEKAARKLHGSIRQVEGMHISGISNEDIMNKAKELCTKDKKYKSGWNFDHVWSLIKNFEKFQDCAESSRQPSRANPSSGSAPNSFSLNLGDDGEAHDENDFGSSPSSRPIGVKKAKMKAKKDEAASSMLSKLREDNKEMLEEIKSSNATLKHQLEDKRAHRVMKEENKILAQDVSSIKDPRYREYVQAEQARIYEKRAQEHGQSNHFASVAYSPFFTGESGSNLPEY